MQIWQVLGIGPTGDRQAIRRAYARCLKHLDPDQDPEAFQRLRFAYEAALAATQGDTLPRGAAEPSRAEETLFLDAARTLQALSRQDDASAPTPPRVRIHVRLRPAPPPTPPPRLRSALAPIDMGTHVAAEGRPILAALERALDEEDSVEAVRLFQTAMARGFLPVELDRTFVLRLSSVAVEDIELPGAAFCALIKHLGWTTALDPPAEPQSEVARKIFARLAAEEWYAALAAAADAGGPRAIAPRVLLGRARRFYHDPAAGREISKRMREYDRHHRWLAARFDLERMNQLYRAYAEEFRLPRRLVRLLRWLVRLLRWLVRMLHWLGRLVFWLMLLGIVHAIAQLWIR